MRYAVERIFEAVESNASCALYAVTAALAITGCLHLLFE
jgi:hypothetical protein